MPIQTELFKVFLVQCAHAAGLDAGPFQQASYTANTASVKDRYGQPWLVVRSPQLLDLGDGDCMLRVGELQLVTAPTTPEPKTAHIGVWTSAPALVALLERLARLD